MLINGITHSDNGDFIPIMERFIPTYSAIYGVLPLYMGLNSHYRNTI